MSMAPRDWAEGVDPRTVFKVKARSRLEVERRGLQFLGDTADWCYFVVPVDSSATKFRQDLEAYQDRTGANALDKFFGDIEGIERYGPADRRGPGLPASGFSNSITVDVLLWPSSDAEEATGRLQQVSKVVETKQGEVLGIDTRPSSTIARVRVSESVLRELLELMVVERIRAPARPFVEPSKWLTVAADDLTAEPPIDVTVGVIDDGVHSGHALLKDLVVFEDSVPSGRSWRNPGVHGSMVAGLAAYGDIEKALRDNASFPPPTRLAVVRVLESDPNNPKALVFPSEVPEHRVIEKAIRTLHEQGVRIINLSIADDHPYSGPHVGLWTESLDRLARELDVLIVAAAGNRGIAPSGEVSEGVSAHNGYPHYTLDQEARIAEPGIAANIVTVGSIARSGSSASPDGSSNIGEVVIAQEKELSPFSRTGPGLQGTFNLGAIKPDFVHYGGNYVWTSYGRLRPDDLGSAVVSTALNSSGRLFSASSGTSFAAPRIARAAAEILVRYPDSSANLLRALLGVSAEIPEQALRQFSSEQDRRRAFGYGIPNEVRAASSERARVILFHEGEIDAGGVAIHPIPMPESFTAGKADRTITVAVAYDPPVRRQRREYTAGHLGFDLYRAMSVDEVEEVARKQPIGASIPNVNDRRRVSKLKPGARTCGSSTLQVRTWIADSANSLNPDDSNTYYLVVKHFKERWASNLNEAYETQRYALTVQLEDRSRATIDLYADLQAQVRMQARATA